MGHNVSRAKQDQIERDRRIAELKPLLVAGWRIDRDRFQIVEIQTVLGHYQRGQELLFRCRRTDCRRRVEVDLRSAVHAGLGDRTLKHLLHMLRCQHWSGCQLEEVSAIYPQGVPLVAYLKHPDVLIVITCLACEARTLLTPQEIIKRLKAAGTGDGSTGVIELGKVIRGPAASAGADSSRQRCYGRKVRHSPSSPGEEVQRYRLEVKLCAECRLNQKPVDLLARQRSAGCRKILPARPSSKSPRRPHWRNERP